MRKLLLAPDADDLSLRRAPGGRGDSLDAPSTAFGLMEQLQASAIDLTWSGLSAWDFDYLMAFWRTATGGGVKPFLVDLPIQGRVPVECRAVFVGPPPEVSRMNGLALTVKAKLEAMPLTPVSASDAALDLITSEV